MLSSRKTVEEYFARCEVLLFYIPEGIDLAGRNRPDKDGTHRGAFEKNKKKIYATQTVCGICGKPVDFSLKYPHPLSPCIDHIIPIAKAAIRVISTICSLLTGHATDRRVTSSSRGTI